MQENFTTIDGNKIRYLESGDSKDVMVLVHGLGASAERWIGVIPAFAKHYRVLVPDLIGFGYSDKPHADYTMEFLADFIAKFIDITNAGIPSMIGSSLGGQITARFASIHHDSIKKLILVSPSGTLKHSRPALDAYIMAALFPNKQSAKTAFEMMEGSGKEIDESIITGFVERMSLPNAKLAFMSTLLGLKDAKEIIPKLKKILVPTMIIWGSKDPVIPIKYAKDFVSSIPNCKFYEMDGHGHTPYVQNPNGFVDVALDFLLDKNT